MTTLRALFGDLQLSYVGLEVPDAASFGNFLSDVVGLMPGVEPGTWRNDSKCRRLSVVEGPSADATTLGFEAVTTEAWTAAVSRLERAGYSPRHATAEESRARQVQHLAYLDAPWGHRIDLAFGLAEADLPFAPPVASAGFVTQGVGLGHVVIATTEFDESDRFVTQGLGLRRTDTVITTIADGIELEIRFYHCNPRHHSIAVAKAPFDLPQRLHHLMFEFADTDDVGYAFDRAWNSGLSIASGLGRHENDGMFSFYVVSPAGFQLEIGHGARLATDQWDEDRRYDRISVWGHQRLQSSQETS